MEDGLIMLFKLNEQLNTSLSLGEFVVNETLFGLKLEMLTFGSGKPVINVKQLVVDESKLESIAVEHIKYEFTPELEGGFQVMFLYQVILLIFARLEIVKLTALII